MPSDSLTPMQQAVADIFRQSAQLKDTCARECAPVVAEMAQMIVEAYRAGHTVFIFGNGGSAADAQHLAGEFVNRMLKNRRALPAVALSTDTSVLTCIANDSHYSQIFARQLEALGKPGDIAWGISTSGNSPNVLAAFEQAAGIGMQTIGFTGGSGGKMASMADLCLTVPSPTTPRIQEVHITAGHAICELVEQMLFP